MYNILHVLMGISLSTEDKHTLGETLRPLGVNIRCWKNPSPVATATSRKEEQDPRAEGWRKGQILLGESRVAFSLTHGPPPHMVAVAGTGSLELGVPVSWCGGWPSLHPPLTWARMAF